jgi:hypothetical protein
VLERVRVDLAPAPLKQRVCGTRQARTATTSRTHVLLQARILPVTGAGAERKQSEVVCFESLPCRDGSETGRVLARAGMSHRRSESRQMDLTRFCVLCFYGSRKERTHTHTHTSEQAVTR